MKATRIFETCIYVREIREVESFYTDVLGLEVVLRDPDRHLMLRCGESIFIVFNARATRNPEAGKLAHGCQGSGHVAFQTTHQELDDWSRHLTRNGIEIEEVVEWEGGARSLYFRDPAGNLLELATPDLWQS